MLVTLVLIGPALSASEKRIAIEKYGFSVEAPASWRVGVGEKDGLPMFVNVPWSKLGPQLRLPAGGATMHIIDEEGLPAGHRDHTLEKWLEFDQVTSKAGTASNRVFDVLPATGITRALLSTFEERTWSRDEQPQRSVAVYWEFHGKRFAMHLSYVVGDPRGKRYEALLMSAVQSIRPLK
jgi:hypothetical protein